MRKKLVSEGHALVPVQKNLVDAVWEDRPPRPINPVIVQPLQWTGCEYSAIMYVTYIMISKSNQDLYSAICSRGFRGAWRMDYV